YVGIVVQTILGRDFPGSFVFFSIIPPFEAVAEFLELDRLGFGVVLPAFGKRLLIVPDFFGGMGPVEEHEIRRNAGVWSEDPVGEADDGVKIKIFEQFFFDASADAVAEKGTVGHDDGGPARFRRPLELSHNKLKEKQSGFGGLLVFGKIAKDTALFLAAEGRVGHDDIDPVFVADLSQRKAQAVQRINLW